VALILLDRVKVNTTTTGTGTVVLANTAPTGYQTFAVIGNANTTYYTIAGQTSAEWEVGIGTYYLANSSLSRDTILSSSAANAAVTFGVGTKDVFVTYPAEKAIYSDSGNVTTITNFASSNVLITGGTISGVNVTANTIATANANITGGTISLLDTGFTLSNATDTTKKAKFDASGIGTGLTVTYTLPQPPASGTASTLVDLQSSQSITGLKTFTGLTQNLGSSTGNTTTNVAYGAAANGNTKTVNIGTAGLSGSITNITVGSANGTTVSVLGNLTATLTGGSINNMTIGATTANTGAFTTITSTGNVNLDAGTFFVDATNNLVGVNTSSPASGLASVMNFGNAASTNFLAQANGTAISQTAGYSFRSTFGNTADFAPRRSADVWSGFNAGNWGTEYLAFGVGNNGGGNDTSTLTAEKMRIQSNGYVGIGTTAPAVTLDVQAASNAVLYARIYNANTNSATQTQLQINTGGKYAALTVSYAGNYFFNQGLGGVVASYTDYDNQYFRNNAGTLQFAIGTTASANNYIQMYGGAGTGPIIQATGADTNIDIKLTPKGTGYANITSGGVKLGNSTIQDSAGNLVFTTGGANVTAFTLDQNKLSTFAASIKETANVSTANATANVTLNAITQSVLYYTGNATANTTINITGNSTVTLNNAMANGQSISVVFMSTQGATAYYVNGYQIDGAAVTPKWQGGTAPTSGNALGIDTYAFTAIKTANATYTVIASQTQFK
jgi:hypothetical protein